MAINVKIFFTVFFDKQLYIFQIVMEISREAS